MGVTGTAFSHRHHGLRVVCTASHQGENGCRTAWGHEWHGALLQDRVGTHVALRTQAPSRPKYKNPPCVTLAPTLSPQHSSASAITPSQGMAGVREGMAFGEQGGELAVPIPQCSKVQPPPHSPHVLRWWPCPSAHPTSHSTMSAQPPRVRASWQRHWQGRQLPMPLSTACFWFGFTLTAMLRCPLDPGSPLQEKMEMGQSSALHNPRSGAQDLLQYYPGAAPGAAPRGQTLVRG